MRNGVIVQTENVRRGDALLKRVIELNKIYPGLFALIRGGAGVGKTSWASLRTTQHGGLFVRARQSWATGASVTDSRAMLTDVLRAARAVNRGMGSWMPASVHELFTQVEADFQRQSFQFLVIDEGDYISGGQRHQSLNILRDLADETSTCIIFLTVQELSARLALPHHAFTETITSRLAAQVEFQRPSLRDAALFAKELVEHVSFDRDLVAWCLSMSRQSVRPMLRLFAEIEAAAVTIELSGPLSLKRCVKLSLGPVPLLMGSANELETVQPLPEPKIIPLKVVRG